MTIVPRPQNVTIWYGTKLWPDETAQQWLVGARGFEPPTSRSQTERTTRLCYAPNSSLLKQTGVHSRGAQTNGQVGFESNSSRLEKLRICARAFARWLILDLDFDQAVRQTSGRNRSERKRDQNQIHCFRAAQPRWYLRILPSVTFSNCGSSLSRVVAPAAHPASAINIRSVRFVRAWWSDSAASSFSVRS